MRTTWNACRVRRQRAGRRRGVITVLTVFLMLGLLAMAAFAVDVSWMQLVRTQMRVSTDLAARAGTEELARSRDEDLAVNTAKEIAAANPVAGRPLQLQNDDIELGRVSKDPAGVYSFTPGLTPLNSVQVFSHRTDDSANGSVNLVFGGVFGRPTFEPETRSTVMREPPMRDIAMVIDRTGSMTEKTGRRRTRWTDLLGAFDLFVAGLNTTEDNEKIGLATYSSGATEDYQLTESYSNVVSVLRSKNPSGTTNIHSGIISGRNIINNNTLRRAQAQKLMVVMTDGLHNTGPSPTVAAKIAAADGIRIITITFGDTSGIPLMQQVAAIGKGKHYHAPGAAELQEIFEEIGTGMEGLQYFE